MAMARGTASGIREGKGAIKSAELLVHFDPEKELLLATDGSDYGVREVLSHEMENGNRTSNLMRFQILK